MGKVVLEIPANQKGHMPVSGTFLPAFFSRPAVFFTLLVGLNSLLAYSPLAWPLKLAAGLLGFGSLGLFYLKNRPPSSAGEGPIYTRVFFTPAPWWVALALLLALTVRLYKLTSYLSFPIPDEVINAYNAIHMKDQWTWNAFYFTTQMPPFYIWLLACVFKFGGVSILNLWLVPALLSFLSVVFYYLAFREVFSRFLSFVCLLLLGVGFWPVFLARFSHNAVLMVFWEALALWLLAKFAKADPSRGRAGLAVSLGLCLGLGFYTYFAWPLVVLWFIPAVWWVGVGSGSRGKGLFALVLAVMFLSALPLVVVAVKEGFGFYLENLFIINPQSSKIFQWDYRQSLYYLTSFLWTGFTGHFTYNPQWGGFLNPILGSLFLLGLAEWLRLRKYSLAKWLAAGFAVLLAPCFLTQNANWYHVAALMPLFIAVAAWGFCVLWARLPRGFTRITIALGLFLLSFLLDWANLEKTMGVADRDNSALNPTVWTCENLQKFGQTNGPGRVYSDFCLDFITPHITLIPDASGGIIPLFTSHWLSCYMSLGAYSINTLVNPALRPAQATWAVLTTDEWARPLLSQWFPGAHFLSNLNQQVHTRSDNSLVAVIPLTPENRIILDGWREADRVLRESDYLQFNHPFQQPFDGIILFLRSHESLFRENAFLRFCYWGKLGYLYYLNKQYDLALPAYQKALQNGANGFLYFGMSCVFEIDGRYAEEKVALLQAANWDSFFQPRLEDLRKLDALAAHSSSTTGPSPGH